MRVGELLDGGRGRLFRSRNGRPPQFLDNLRIDVLSCLEQV